MSEEVQKEKGVLNLSISLGGINMTQKAMFAKNLSLMLKSGLTISEALETIEDQSVGKFRKVINAINRSVLAGNSLSQSLAQFPKIFSRFFVNTVMSGEQSGNLENNLNNIAEQLKKDKELVAKVKSAMIYPTIVLIAAVVLGFSISFLVLPKITPLFEGLKVDLPLSTKLLIWISHYMQKSGISILVALVSFSALFIWFVRQDFSKPVTHYFLPKFPIIKNITRNSNLANFSRTLGTLLKSGLNIDEALNIVRETVGNHYFGKSLQEVARKVSQGGSISENLELYEKLFPRLIVNMVKVGEKSGNLEETFFHMAEFYEIEVDNSTKALTTALEPLLLIFIGVVVGGLAISIIGPIYKITGNVQR